MSKFDRIPVEQPKADIAKSRAKRLEQKKQPRRTESGPIHSELIDELDRIRELRKARVDSNRPTIKTS